MQAETSCQPKHGSWVDRVVDSLLPPQCQSCGSAQPLLDGLCLACKCSIFQLGGQCPRCAAALPGSSGQACGRCLQQPHAIDQAWAGFAYGPVIAPLLRQLKFSHQLAAADSLGRLLARLDCPLNLSQVDMLIPAPLHLSRLRQRGFNQALELCRPLARQQQLDIRRDVLWRTHATHEQSRLSARQRQRNVAQAFTCRSRLQGEHVLLFDDVMTTGATMQAMAQCLKQAGAGQVSAIAVARA